MITKSTSHKRIIFLGNSLSFFGESGGALLAGNMRYSLSVYSSIVALNRKIAFHNFSTGGIQTSQQITNFPAQYAPYIRPNDIVIWWELRNDLRVLDDATAAYNNAITLTNLIKATGAKCVMLDMIAGDGASDPVDFQTLWATLNSNVYTNRASLCDLLIQVSTIPNLSQLSDTTNGTYYIQGGDKVHLMNAGYDLVAAKVYSELFSNGLI